MFDELLRELRHRGGKYEVAITLASDEEGFFDRECPSPECQFEFKVNEDDWRDKVRDDEVFCPFCGHTADADHWWTQKQLQHAGSVAQEEIEGFMADALKRGAWQWNSRQARNSFFRLTMQIDKQPSPVSMPPAAAALMRFKIACPVCACRYAVIGAAFFCPSCGHNAADQMFNQSVAGIRKSIDVLPDLRSALADRDAAENTCRIVIEGGLQNAVMAFQRYAETLYAKFPSLPQPRRNAFQNLAEGSGLWHAATGKRYDDYLDAAQLATLTRCFQQRHLLSHTQGLVDAEYIARTGDTAYRVGQRIVVREASVRDCSVLVETLAAAMMDDADSRTLAPAPKAQAPDRPRVRP